jgi:hypothetical protein
MFFGFSFIPHLVSHSMCARYLPFEPVPGPLEELFEGRSGVAAVIFLARWLIKKSCGMRDVMSRRCWRFPNRLAFPLLY